MKRRGKNEENPNEISHEKKVKKKLGAKQHFAVPSLAEKRNYQNKNQMGNKSKKAHVHENV